MVYIPSFLKLLTALTPLHLKPDQPLFSLFLFLNSALHPYSLIFMPLPFPWCGMPSSPYTSASLSYIVCKLQCYLSSEAFLGTLTFRHSPFYRPVVLSMYLNHSFTSDLFICLNLQKVVMPLMQELHLSQSRTSFREQNPP